MILGHNSNPRWVCMGILYPRVSSFCSSVQLNSVYLQLTGLRRRLQHHNTEHLILVLCTLAAINRCSSCRDKQKKTKHRTRFAFRVTEKGPWERHADRRCDRPEVVADQGGPGRGCLQELRRGRRRKATVRCQPVPARARRDLETSAPFEGDAH